MAVNRTEVLASFMAELDHGSFPTQVRTRVQSILLDALASAVLGRGGPDTTKMERLAQELTGTGDSTVIGAATSSPAGACLINAYQITAFNLCDVYRPAHCHMSPIAVAPALAAAERHHASGPQLLTAVAVGLETACRVGAALDFREFRRRGWHSPGVIGPFGGAAAVGSLLGLDAAGMRNALGLAGSQSGGTMAQWGTPTIKFHQSRGALSGLTAGLLAGEGYRAGEDVIAADVGGTVGIFSGGGSPERLVEGLGDRWELMDISLKRWPSGSGVQTTVSSLFSLIEEHDVEPSSIDTVRLVLPLHAYEAHGEMGWDDRFKAMLSARYLTAAILHDRSCWIEQFGDDRRQDPTLDAFARERVDVEVDEGLKGSAAVTEIRLAGGEVLRDVRDHPKGDPADPLELDDVVAKFRDASASMQLDLDGVLDSILALDEVDDVSEVLIGLRSG